jgi:hypothetical protein
LPHSLVSNGKAEVVVGFVVGGPLGSYLDFILLSLDQLAEAQLDEDYAKAF